MKRNEPSQLSRASVKLIRIFLMRGFLMRGSLLFSPAWLCLIPVGGQDPVASAGRDLIPADRQVPSLEQAFLNPPASARPRTWWHWTGGNISREGITKDLEWMSRVGIAGMQLADVGFGMGQEVENKLWFGSTEWLDAVRFAAEEADRLGLEMAIFSSAGWSIAGGPWVESRQAMKKLVWSTNEVEGPTLFSAGLVAPPSCNGPIGNYSPGSPGNRQQADPEFYRDERVLAFPAPPDEQDIAGFGPRFTSGTASISDPGALLDDDLNSRLTLYRQPGEDRIRLYMDFKEPFPARALTIASPAGIPAGRLLAGDDSNRYETLLILPGVQNYRGGRVRTFSFPASISRHYLLELTGMAPRPADFITQPEPAVPDSVILAALILHTGGRVHRWEDKAGFSLLNEYGSSPTPETDRGSLVPAGKVIDLSNRVDETGKLNWKVPEGKWIILRTGYSLTGAKNRPPVPSGLGYEVDKLNEDYVREYMEAYMCPLRDALGPLYGRRLQYVLLDSWEAGMQNWTDDMVSEFTSRRGYDPVPYLPALAGYVVQSAEVSDRFLWDFRRTLADMFAENFYGTVTGYLHEEGLQTYGEASGVSLEILEDALLCKKYVDIPMGEFWVRDLHPGPIYYVDIRGAASAAHVYGKTLVAAEAFTGGSYESPSTLKRISDYWFTRGVNRLVFHTSAHQPLDTKPGNTMVGTHLNRNMTWAEQAGPFMDYLSRNSCMLQQGVFVADLAYLLDEGAPSSMPFWGSGLTPAPPDGYDYDYVNTDVLLNRMSVDSSGRIVLQGGMSYAVLVLPNTGRMTLKVLKKVHELVRAGATVAGSRVIASPSLADYPRGDSEIRELALDLWADLDGITRTRNHFGRGMVVWGESPGQVLDLMQLSPDVQSCAGPGPELSWIHRRTGDMEIYFLASHDPGSRGYDVRFRVNSREVEFWDPVDGSIRPAPYSFEGNTTRIPLELEGYGTVFVVFRDSTGIPSRPGRRGKETDLMTVEGPWEVNFRPGPGSPGKIILDRLGSWTENPLDEVRYFSGTADYFKDLVIPGSFLKSGNSLYLDLGQVKDLAEVSLNDRRITLLWKEPYRVNVSDQLKRGLNRLEISVTNEWTNRIIGDMHAGEGEKVLDSLTIRMFGRTELKESGLIGPVRIVSVLND
jgi:hypothetical protein